MSKKKANSRDNEAKKLAEQKQLDERFLERITIIGKALIGDAFNLIPQRILNHLVSCRPPRLKAKAKEGSDVPKEIVVKYNKLLSEFIKGNTVKIYSGEEIPLDWYLSEGLMLVGYFHWMKDSVFREVPVVREAFQQYSRTSEHYDRISQLLGEIILQSCIFLSDFNHYFYLANIELTVSIKNSVPYKTIFIRRMRLDKSHVTIDNHRRPILRVVNLFGDYVSESENVKPSQIGFEGPGTDIPGPVYIQEHALRKLQERIDITPGLIHFAIACLFNPENINYIKFNNTHMVPLDIASGKIGYLICRWCEGKIIITTFLFLTNDGTPEGKKLEELTMLKKIDKQYLQIDTVQHFLSYHIDQNEELKNLFIEAGCGSLFNIGLLQKYSVNEVKDKDPESISKYLSDVAMRIREKKWNKIQA
jgi:hypothetical protein